MNLSLIRSMTRSAAQYGHALCPQAFKNLNFTLYSRNNNQHPILYV